MKDANVKLPPLPTYKELSDGSFDGSDKRTASQTLASTKGIIARIMRDGSIKGKKLG